MFSERPLVLPKKVFNWQLIVFITLAAVGFVAIVVGLHSLISFSNTSCFIEEAASEASNSASLSLSQGLIYVDLAGAVKEPGIYQLTVGSRLATAIDQAGGFTSQADPTHTSQELNLAQRLNDGDKIYIFSQKEREYQQDAAEFCRVFNAVSTSVDSGEEAQISINSASVEDLQALEGIGEKRAAEILAGRPYQSLAELVEKKVLTTSLFNKIQNQLKL